MHARDGFMDQVARRAPQFVGEHAVPDHTVRHNAAAHPPPAARNLPQPLIAHLHTCRLMPILTVLECAIQSDAPDQ